MSICYHGSGSLFFNSATTENSFKLKDELVHLLNISDPNSRYMWEGKKKLFQFVNYTRYTFMENFKKILTENINEVDTAQIWFTCYDEDSVPFEILIEVADGEISEQSLTSRLAPEWSTLLDNEWFLKPKKEEKKEKKSEEKRKEDFKEDDLPF